jgi:type II secretory pathway pseudopilin PulG
MRFANMRQGGDGAGAWARDARSGFSLVELLVVIFIVILLVSILIPALGSVRKSAKKTETEALVATVASAVKAFALDNRRSPGYFTPSEMGSDVNATQRTFSGMQNVMLDLAGGVRTGSASTFKMGPGATAQTQADVDPSAIGVAVAGSNLYFQPQAKNFRVLEKEQRFQGGTTDNWRMPELLDAFGAPILAWSQDDGARQPIDAVDDFARRDSGERARFYWGSNAAFLGDDSQLRLGTRLIAQGTAGRASLLYGAETDEVLSTNLTALLGSPSAPNNVAQPRERILPTAARGTVVLHGAGEDGIFLSRGWRSAGKYVQDGNLLHFGSNFKDATNNAWNDRDGKATSLDVIAETDDIVRAAE